MAEIQPLNMKINFELNSIEATKNSIGKFFSPSQAKRIH